MGGKHKGGGLSVLWMPKKRRHHGHSGPKENKQFQPAGKSGNYGPGYNSHHRGIPMLMPESKSEHMPTIHKLPEVIASTSAVTNDDAIKTVDNNAIEDAEDSDNCTDSVDGDYLEKRRNDDKDDDDEKEDGTRR